MKLSIFIISMALMLQALISFYPRQRLVHWLEFITDGYMPSSIANLGQNVLSNMWIGGFRNKAVQGDGQILQSLLSFLQRNESNNLIIELAAGGGVAPIEWGRAIHAAITVHDSPASSKAAIVATSSSSESKQHLQQETPSPRSLRILLTDLQPNVEKWKQLSPVPEYINTPVDATNLRESLTGIRSSQCSSSTSSSSPPSSASPADGCHSVSTINGTDIAAGNHLRMIHFALHHFPPPLVRSIFEDTIRSNAAIVVADLVPSPGGILWLFPLSLQYIAKLENILYLIKNSPVWTPLLLPLLPLMAWHDAVVSVLRAYSVKQLTEIVSQIDIATLNPDSAYEINVYHSGSYSQWMGLPTVVQEHAGLGLDESVVQYFVLQPIAK